MAPSSTGFAGDCSHTSARRVSERPLSGFRNEQWISYIKGPKKAKIHRFFAYFFGLFSKYLAPSGAKYCGQGGFVTKIGEGGSTDTFWDF